VVALFLGQVTVATSFMLLDRGRPPQPPFGNIERLLFAARVIDSEPDVSTRATLLASFRRSDPTLKFLSHAPQPDRNAPELPQTGGNDPELFFARVHLDDTSEPLVVAKLSDGSAIAMRRGSFGVPARGFNRA
jgi:hypothetical protein